MTNSIRTMLLWLSASFAWAASPDFAKDVAPILNKYCVGCHNADEAEAELRLDSFAALIEGGENGSAIDSKQPESSLLLKRLMDAENPMPPEGEPRPEKSELEVLRRWLKTGANAPISDVDPTVVNFDSITPSESPRPVTALAFGSADSSKGAELVLIGQGATGALDIRSNGGFLRSEIAKPPAPFAIVLSNTKTNLALGAPLGTTVNLNGVVRLGIYYDGTDPENDLQVLFGDVNFQMKKMPYRLDGKSRSAVASFGKVMCFDELRATTPKFELTTPGKVHDVRYGLKGRALLAASGVAGLRGEAILWDMKTGKVAQSFKGHGDAVYAAALSEDGKLVATGSYDRKIIIWDTQSGKALRTLEGHNGAVYDVEFSPDAKVLVSASADTTVKVWSVATGQRLDTMGQPLKEQYSVDVSPDGKHIVAGGEDNRIRMWQLVSRDTARINPLVHARFAHEGAVEQVRFSNDGKHVVSSSSDGTVKVWSAEMELLDAYDVPVAMTEGARHHS